jgi:hypothetical protein
MAYVVQQQNNQLSHMINYLTTQADAVAGLPGVLPRIPVPRPAPPPVSNTTVNQIKIDNSVIGTVNTGTVDRIEVHMDHISQSGNEEVAGAIKELTEAVAKDTELDTKLKNRLLEWIDLLASEATKPKQSRVSGLVQSLLTSLNTLLSKTQVAFEVWSRIKTVLEGFFA